VFPEIDGVVKLEVAVAVLVDSRFPPVEASYHLKVPGVEEVAPSKTVPVPQVEPFVPVGAVGMVFTKAVTIFLGVEVHDPLSNST
jgi:hypothetical protein